MTTPELKKDVLAYMLAKLKKTYGNDWKAEDDTAHWPEMVYTDGTRRMMQSNYGPNIKDAEFKEV